VRTCCLGGPERRTRLCSYEFRFLRNKESLEDKTSHAVWLLLESTLLQQSIRCWYTQIAERTTMVYPYPFRTSSSCNKPAFLVSEPRWFRSFFARDLRIPGRVTSEGKSVNKAIENYSYSNSYIATEVTRLVVKG
jgi:hypothetical protein